MDFPPPNPSASQTEIPRCVNCPRTEPLSTDTRKCNAMESLQKRCTKWWAVTTTTAATLGNPTGNSRRGKLRVPPEQFLSACARPCVNRRSANSFQESLLSCHRPSRDFIDKVKISLCSTLTRLLGHWRRRDTESKGGMSERCSADNRYSSEASPTVITLHLAASYASTHLIPKTKKLARCLWLQKATPNTIRVLERSFGVMRSHILKQKVKIWTWRHKTSNQAFRRLRQKDRLWG